MSIDWNSLSDEDRKYYASLSPEELEIELALERGDLKSLPPEEKERITKITKEAAANYLKKDARINIRISSADLRMLKMRASREGLPYQTMIAGILHKVATGLWDEKP